MRYTFALIFTLMAIALGACAFFSLRSKKRIGKPVSRLMLSLIPPVFGNILVVVSSKLWLATVGYYIYIVGMDAVVVALLYYTFQYCYISWPGKIYRYLLYGLVILDVLQILTNPLHHRTFALEPILVAGKDYFRMIPLLGQSFHRVLDYGIFFVVLLIFFYKMIHAPRVYAERYSVIFIAMMIFGLWETFYIVSRTPVDRSMVGFGGFGLLVYFFSMRYRPNRLLDRMLVQVASQMDASYFFFDALGRSIWANETGRRLLELSEEEYDQIGDRLAAKLGRITLGKNSWREQRVLGEGDARKFFVLEKQTLTDPKGKLVGSFIIVQDQTEEQRALQIQQYNSRHDTLTGLFNREYLIEVIRQRLDEKPWKPQLVMMTDVSNFKIINDIFGSQFGDLTLKRIGELVGEIAGDQGVYGRYSGDTFGICMPEDAFDEAAATQLLHQFSISDERVTHNPLIQLGIYPVTEGDRDVTKMFDRARMALGTVKNDYNHVVAWYSDKMREDARWDQYISSQLPTALANREIQPYLQPIVDEKGKLVGAEALVRWIHPKTGFMAPARFVPVFERNGMIAEVDKYMWRCACEILADWKKRGIDLFLSVNVSQKDFFFMDVRKEIRDIVKEFDVSPDRLRVEITETVMMTDMENRIRILNDLKEDGFLIEMDDFGSGYSSLNMLKDMPIDLIKIDMMFLKQTQDDQKAQTILRNILHLSEDLGIISLTEGVETESQYHMLAERGCNLFQGYYFAKPMSLTDYEIYREKSLAVS